jgi:hypothetical protein
MPATDGRLIVAKNALKASALSRKPCSRLWAPALAPFCGVRQGDDDRCEFSGLAGDGQALGAVEVGGYQDGDDGGGEAAGQAQGYLVACDAVAA